VTSNNYINANNAPSSQTVQQSSVLNTTSLIESNNLILLTEFFKAVGNGELEKLKQILLNVDEINANLKKNLTNNKKLTNSLSQSGGINGSPPISMTKVELLNAGMVDADGLTALSIAAGRKHKALTEFLADYPGNCFFHQIFHF